MRKSSDVEDRGSFGKIVLKDDQVVPEDQNPYPTRGSPLVHSFGFAEYTLRIEAVQTSKV